MLIARLCPSNGLLSSSNLLLIDSVSGSNKGPVKVIPAGEPPLLVLTPKHRNLVAIELSLEERSLYCYRDRTPHTRKLGTYHSTASRSEFDSYNLADLIVLSVCFDSVRSAVSAYHR